MRNSMFEPFFGSHYFRIANQNAINAKDAALPLAVDLLNKACQYAKKAIQEMDTIKQLSPFQIKYLKLEAKNRLSFWEKQLNKLTRKQYESWEKLWS